MKDWEKIRRARNDVTDYVIHSVKGKLETDKYTKPFTVLVDILKCGYLKPGFAIMTPLLRNPTPRPTVKKPDPAVCFTEQTLDCFIESCRQLSLYNPYGIAVHKYALYSYGGRPVIYGSEDILGEKMTPSESSYQEGKEIYKGSLPVDFQYLWVEHRPHSGPRRITNRLYP